PAHRFPPGFPRAPVKPKSNRHQSRTSITTRMKQYATTTQNAWTSQLLTCGTARVRVHKPDASPNPQRAAIAPLRDTNYRSQRNFLTDTEHRDVSATEL